MSRIVFKSEDARYRLENFLTSDFMSLEDLENALDKIAKPASFYCIEIDLTHNYGRTPTFVINDSYSIYLMPLMKQVIALKGNISKCYLVKNKELILSQIRIDDESEERTYTIYYFNENGDTAVGVDIKYDNIHHQQYSNGAVVDSKYGKYSPKKGWSFIIEGKHPAHDLRLKYQAMKKLEKQLFSMIENFNFKDYVF